MNPATLREPARDTAVFGEFDIVVLGGGPAGIAAASAAAQAGCKTLLLEHYGFLGGMGTAAGVTNFCGLHANVHGEIRQVVHGVADQLLARIRSLGGLNEPHTIFGGKIAAQAYDNAALKLAADGLVADSGAQLLFHARAVGVAMSSAHRIDALFIETKSGRRAVRGRIFIDCSGDGDLAAFAGAPFEVGPVPADGIGRLLPIDPVPVFLSAHGVTRAENDPPMITPAAAQKKAWIPVWARPRISAWMSCVPS